MKLAYRLIAAFVAAQAGLAAHAAISADEAKALGSTLTPVGAEKIGPEPSSRNERGEPISLRRAA